MVKVNKKLIQKLMKSAVKMNLRKSIWLITGILITVPLMVFGIVHWCQNKYDALPYFGGKEINANGIQTNHIIKDFEMVNQNGKLFKSKIDLNNKIVIANFFFTSCGVVCPNMMRHVQQIQSIYLNDTNIAFISFTVDPVRDDANKLNDYVLAKSINTKNWNLLTGDKKEIYKLARKSFYLSANDGDGGEDDFIHSEQLVLIDKNKQIRGYYDGTNDNAVAQLKLDIKKLAHEN